MSLVHSIVIALALVSGACNKDNSATGEPAQEAMGLYAKGFNTLIAEPKKMITDYFDAVSDDGPTPGSKPKIWGSNTWGLSKIKEAREAFAKAKEAAPPSLANLAAPADEALVAIEKVATTFTEAQKYYESENYKDDNFAKGKQLHTQMVEASKQFSTALGKLEDGLSVIEDQQAIVELEKHAGGKGYGYWFRLYNIEAKKFLHAVERASTAEQRAALASSYQTVSKANEEMGKFVAAKGTKLHASFTSYVGMVTSYNATATKLLRLLKDAKPDEEAIGREMDSLVRNYNSLVSMANSLYQIEDAGVLN